VVRPLPVDGDGALEAGVVDVVGVGHDVGTAVAADVAEGHGLGGLPIVDGDGRGERRPTETAVQPDPVAGGHEVAPAVPVQVGDVGSGAGQHLAVDAIGEPAVALQEDVDPVPHPQHEVEAAVPVEVAGGQGQGERVSRRVADGGVGVELHRPLQRSVGALVQDEELRAGVRVTVGPGDRGQVGATVAVEVTGHHRLGTGAEPVGLGGAEDVRLRRRRQAVRGRRRQHRGRCRRRRPGLPAQEHHQPPLVVGDGDVRSTVAVDVADGQGRGQRALGVREIEQPLGVERAVGRLGMDTDPPIGGRVEHDEVAAAVGVHVTGPHGTRGAQRGVGLRRTQGAVGLLVQEVEPLGRIAAAHEGDVRPSVAVHVGHRQVRAPVYAGLFTGRGQTSAGQLGEHHHASRRRAGHDVGPPVPRHVAHLEVLLRVGGELLGGGEGGVPQVAEDAQPAPAGADDVDAAVPGDVGRLHPPEARIGDRLTIGEAAVTLQVEVDGVAADDDGVGPPVAVEVAGR
jgi:hypothetical protein